MNGDRSLGKKSIFQFQFVLHFGIEFNLKSIKMRLNKKYLLCLAATSVLIFAFTKAVPADDELNRESLLIEAVMQSLASSHYKALPIDDAFSKKCLILTSNEWTVENASS